MAARNFINQPYNAAMAALTASGFSPSFSNTGYANIDAEVVITAAPTGTTPTLTVQLQGSLDNVNFYNIGAATASLNGVGRTMLSNTNVDDPFLRLAYVVTGTTPSYTGLEIEVFGF